MNSHLGISSEAIDIEGSWTSTDMGGDVSDGASTDMGGESDFQAQTEAQIQDSVDSLSQIESLSPEIWQQLDGAERLDVLQDIENRMAAVQGRQAVPIGVEPMPPGVYGGYIRGEGIILSEEHLASDDIRELVDSVVHEGRHAYQDHAVRNPAFVSDTEVVESWQQNWDNYLTAEEYGQELYESQPIERDAWQYAAQVTDALFGPRGG